MAPFVIFGLAYPELLSILHYAKATMSLVLWPTYSDMWGTVGSGMMSGSRQDGQFPEKPDSGSGNPEKPEIPEKCM